MDGFVIYCLAEDDPMLDAVLERRLPVVLVEHPSREEAPSVETDDVSGARAAAEHLLGLGHERLGVVSFELGRDASGGLAGLERRRRRPTVPAGSGSKATPPPSRTRGFRADVPVYEVAGEHAGAG